MTPMTPLAQSLLNEQTLVAIGFVRSRAPTGAPVYRLPIVGDAVAVEAALDAAWSGRVELSIRWVHGVDPADRYEWLGNTSFFFFFLRAVARLLHTEGVSLAPLLLDEPPTQDHFAVFWRDQDPAAYAPVDDDDFFYAYVHAMARRLHAQGAPVQAALWQWPPTRAAYHAWAHAHRTAPRKEPDAQ